MLDFGRSFAADDSGSATVEAAIWVPAFVAMLLLVVDVSMIFNGQARMLRTVQDTNRALSVGRLHSPREAEQAIIAALAGTTSDARVSTKVEHGLIITTLTVPARDLDAVGYFSALETAAVTVTSQHWAEF
jgi:Flp pilus assembly protein TadG